MKTKIEIPRKADKQIHLHSSKKNKEVYIIFKSKLVFVTGSSCGRNFEIINIVLYYNYYYYYSKSKNK